MNEYQCNNSMICKSTTCHHAKPHSPDYPHNCDKPAPCGQWPENPNFQPMVKCIPVDQVKPIDDCPDCGKEESKGHHPKECINVIKQERDQLKALLNEHLIEWEKDSGEWDEFNWIDRVSVAIDSRLSHKSQETNA